MPELQVIARHTMRPGTEDDVLPLVAELVAAARTEAGNLAFDAYRSIDEPTSYVLLERYASRDAFATHRETQQFKDIVLDRLAPILESRSVEMFDVGEPQAESAVVMMVFVTEPAAPLCVRVCDYLDQHGYGYERVALVADIDLQAMTERTGYTSCPVVMVGDQVIGMFEDTIEAHESGRLAELLAA